MLDAKSLMVKRQRNCLVHLESLWYVPLYTSFCFCLSFLFLFTRSSSTVSIFLILQRKSSSNGTCLEVLCDANGLTLKFPNEISTSGEGNGKETTENNIHACSSTDNDFLGVENEGLDVSETDFTDKNIYKLPAQNNASPHSKEICDLSSDNTVSSKIFNVSGDLESVHPEAPSPKTVRSWLKDPHLHKVPYFKPRADYLDNWIVIFVSNKINFFVSFRRWPSL